MMRKPTYSESQDSVEGLLRSHLSSVTFQVFCEPYFTRYFPGAFVGSSQPSLLAGL